MYFKDKWGDKIPFKVTTERDGNRKLFVCYINPWGDEWHSFGTDTTKSKAILSAKNFWERDQIINDARGA